MIENALCTIRYRINLKSCEVASAETFAYEWMQNPNQLSKQKSEVDFGPKMQCQKVHSYSKSQVKKWILDQKSKVQKRILDQVQKVCDLKDWIR